MLHWPTYKLSVVPYCCRQPPERSLMIWKTVVVAAGAACCVAAVADAPSGTHSSTAAAAKATRSLFFLSMTLLFERNPPGVLTLADRRDIRVTAV